MVFSNNLLMGAAAAASGGDAVWVPKGAVKLNGTDETLKDASTTAGNRRTFTISMWIKKCDVDVDYQVLAGASDATSFTDAIGIGYHGGGGSDDIFYMYVNNTQLATSAVFRDPSAWYHVFWAIDTTQAVAANRVRCFVNGVNYTLSGTQPSLNFETNFNRSSSDYGSGGMYIGSNYDNNAFFDGYISEYALIDGIAYTPSSFGQYNSKGVWVPVDLSDLTWTGANSAWLDFSDSSSLGTDVNGNNNYTPSGLAAANWTYDRPADEAGDTGNYCTLNSAYREGSGYNLSLSNGNLTYSNASYGLVTSAIGTFPMNSGKFYWEVTLGATTSTMSTRIGIAQVDDRAVNPDGSSSIYLGRTAKSWGFAAWGAYTEAGKKENNASWADYLNATSTTGDVISVAFDADNGAIWIAKNGTWTDGSRTGQSSATVLASIETYANTYVMFDGLTDGPYVPVFTFDGSNGAATTNFGQTAFAYTPPSGFKKLNTSNMSEPAVSKSSDNFLPIIYEGNGTGQRVGNFIPFTDSYAVNYSARFDSGDSDYLLKTFTSSEGAYWTYSCWYKPAGNTGSYRTLLQAGSASGSRQGIQIQDDSTGGGLDIYGSGGSNSGSAIMPAAVGRFGTWVNIVISWSNGAIKVYLDGVEQTLTTNTWGTGTSFIGTNTTHRIGTKFDASAQFLDGYLAEIVFVTGTGTGAVLTPSSFGQTDTSTNRWIPKDVSGLTFGTNGFYLPFPQKTAYGLDTSQGASAALDAQTLFLANFDGSDAATSATDASNFSHTITFAGNAQLDTAIKRFGTASLLLDGSGDYVSMASFPALGSNAFCIEGWAYLTDGSGTQLAFIGNRDGGADDDSWLINIGGTAKRMSVRTDNTEVMSSNTDITLNTWTHIAYTWDGTTNRLFQAGALVASSTSFSPNYSDTNTLYIGHDGRGTTNDWPGSIDEVRVVKGSAVYTSTFTPPASAYSAPAAGNMFIPFSMDQTYGSNQMYGTPSQNFAIQNDPQSNASLSLGNLKTTQTASGSGNWGRSKSTIPLPANSKIYIEAYIDEIGNASAWGLISSNQDFASGDGGFSGANAVNMQTYNSGWATSHIYSEGSAVFSRAALLYATGNWIQMAINTSTKEVWFGVNNSWFDSSGGTTGNPSTGANATCTYTTDADMFPAVWMYYGSPYGQPFATFNYGQLIYHGGSDLTLSSDAGGHFKYTPPTDYKALQQDNLEENTAGITGFAWIKNRDAADSHILADRVRGAGLYLESDDSAVEATNTNSVQRFLQQGVQVGNMDAVNTDGESYVLWQWAGNGTGTTNSDGSGADVTVSANATAGFSIVKYVGDDTSGRTIGTGLTAQPAFILIKNMDNASYDWQVYHQSIGNTASLSLNVTATISTSSTYWNNTSPATSSPFVFSLGDSVATNKASDDFIAYVWAEIEGYSQFGEYTGNGNADGPVINLGFKPAFVLIKATQRSNNWHIFDSARNPYNQITNDALFPDLNLAEGGTNAIDFFSNSFKLRTSEVWLNASSSNNYIYAAFAENPFGGSGVAPATAR